MAIGARPALESLDPAGGLQNPRRSRLPLIVLCAFLILIIAALRWGYTMEEQLGLPMLFIWRGPVTPPEGALIVRIDDPSLEAFRNLPIDREFWPDPLASCARELGGLDGLRAPLNETDLPRGVYACAVRTLDRMGAAGVQLDVVFPANAGRLPGTIALRQSLEEAPFTGLFGMAEMARQREAGHIEVQRNDPTIEALGFGLGSWALTKGDAYNMMFWSRRDDFDVPLQLPLAAALGRMAKSVMPQIESRGLSCPKPSLAAIHAQGQGLAQLLLCVEADAHRLAGLPKRDIARIERLVALARDRTRTLFFNYYGPPSTLPSIGIAQLLGVGDWPEDLPALENSVAFVGHQNLLFPTTLDDLNAVYKHPNGLGMSGVESAATAYLNIWHDDHIRPLPEWLRLGMAAMVFFAIAYAGATRRPWTGMTLATATALSYIAICLLTFSFARIWLPWLPTLLALPFTLVMTATGGYARASRIVTRLAGKEIATSLLDHEPDDELEDRDTTGTVLYCDLEGYSRVARERGRGTAAQLIKRMFEGMERNILAENGHIHQITGDGIIACWFDDPSLPSDADRACRCALASQAVMADLNAYLRSEFGVQMRLRIGLNAGPLLVTGMGRQKLHIAVVGDTINKGERIEQLCKRFGHFKNDVAILIDQSVRSRLSRDAGFEPRSAGRHILPKSDLETEVFHLED